MGVAAKIGEIAKSKGIALKELSREIDVPYTTLYNAVKRDSKMEFETVQKIADALNVPWYVLLGEEDALHGLVKAESSVDYDSEKERLVIDEDGRIRTQNLDVLKKQAYDELMEEHPEFLRYSKTQIFEQERRRRYLDELFYCLNEKGQEILNEVAKGICMLDSYRVGALPTASDFLSYEKAIQKSLPEDNLDTDDSSDQK